MWCRSTLLAQTLYSGDAMKLPMTPLRCLYLGVAAPIRSGMKFRQQSSQSGTAGNWNAKSCWRFLGDGLPVSRCRESWGSRPKPLPKTGTGKILKRELREAYWQGKQVRVAGLERAARYRLDATLSIFRTPFMAIST